MIGLILLVILLVIGIGYFLYKNRQDERGVEAVLRATKAADEADDKTSIN